MASIAELLKYKDELKIVHPTTGKTLTKVWLKVLGDESIKEAYKYARIESAKKRAQLRDMNSSDYQDEIESVAQLDTDTLKDIISASKENDFTRESVAAVARSELPKIEEIAIEPDAPSLEEQEKLDKAEERVTTEFMRAVEQYVQQRKEELNARLENATREELVEMAKEESAKIIPMQAFMVELDDQKGFRGTFLDKECKTRAFKTIEEFKDTHTTIKSQIITAYKQLEMNPDDVKN